MLRAKFLLGLFEHPYVDAERRGASAPTDRALARRAAERGDRAAEERARHCCRSIPRARSRSPSSAPTRPSRGWAATAARPTIRSASSTGCARALGDKVKVTTAPGCGLTDGNRGWADDVVELSDAGRGRPPDRRGGQGRGARPTWCCWCWARTSSSRARRGPTTTWAIATSLDLPGRQMELARAVLAHRPADGAAADPRQPADDPRAGAERAGDPGRLLSGRGDRHRGRRRAVRRRQPGRHACRSACRAPIGTIPAYYNYKPSARRLYLFEQPGPLWPFGYGLSYTTFRYDNLAVTPAEIAPDGKTTVSVTVTNSGKRASDEVVQLYIHDVVSSVTRPVQELKGFRRIHLAPGESKQVAFPLGFDELCFYDVKMKRVVEPGRFEVMVGGSSDNVKKVSLDVVAR